MIKEEVSIKWCSKTKRRFEEKGYIFTEFGDYFNCKKEDLRLIKNSDQFIPCKCDYCGKDYEIQIKKYFRAMDNKILSNNSCEDCRNKKVMELKIKKYGTANPRVICRNNRNILKMDYNKKLTAFSMVIDKFKEKGYIMCPTIYINNEEKLPYICNKHKSKGIQWINWSHLQSDRGCYYCGKESMIESQKCSYQEVKNAIEKNGKNKLISKKYNGYKSYDLKISCEECGDEYTTSFGWFLKGKTKCNNCNSSKGEQRIVEILKANNVDFVREYEIFTNEWKNALRLDFYIKNKRIAIEYDGIQHFEPIDFNGLGREYAKVAFENQIVRDGIKNRYCIENNINLIRIPHTDFENIEKIFIKVGIITKDMRISL